MEGSTPAAEVDGCKKRPLELGRPAFMAREGGAYHVLEMPKKHRCGYHMANPSRARSHLLTCGNAGGGDGTSSREEKKKRGSWSSTSRKESGAYTILEMPKKYKCDPARSNSAFTNALDAEDARLLAMCFRETSVTNKYRQELQAVAAARRTQLI
uniref:Uncharacterized protein n=1 Tax=Setaria viridis TaxID=4556 RepID=A0A4U6WA96_SETVI|nr:hypothetical protein SEVIR_1G169000v2 [Setaria viridis]